MPHISSPVLRRIVDEPMAVADRDRRHLESCGRCQAERAEAAQDAALAERLLAAPRQACDVDLEWILLQHRLAEPGPARRPAVSNPWRMPRRLARLSLGTGTAAAAAVIAVGVGAAAALNSVYTPTRVAPVTVSPSDLTAVENLTGLSVGQMSGGLPSSGARHLPFGTLSWTSAGPAQQVGSVAQARALTHLPYTAPATLPAGVGAPGNVAIQPQVTATMNFSQNAGSGVAGSTLEITGGPAIAVQYGGRTGQAGRSDLTTLVIAVMRRPAASSTGASARQLESFLLSRGGLPTGLAQELRVLGNPGTTLPVPVPTGMSAQQLKIGGAPAVLITDPSGAASGVIWESRDGLVHAVGGLLDSKDVLSVARQIG
jgi:hypothetical protein